MFRVSFLRFGFCLILGREAFCASWRTVRLWWIVEVVFAGLLC